MRISYTVALAEVCRLKDREGGDKRSSRRILSWILGLKTILLDGKEEDQERADIVGRQMML